MPCPPATSSTARAGRASPLATPAPGVPHRQSRAAVDLAGHAPAGPRAQVLRSAAPPALLEAPYLRPRQASATALHAPLSSPDQIGSRARAKARPQLSNRRERCAIPPATNGPHSRAAGGSSSSGLSEHAPTVVDIRCVSREAACHCVTSNTPGQPTISAGRDQAAVASQIGANQPTVLSRCHAFRKEPAAERRVARKGSRRRPTKYIATARRRAHKAERPG